MKKVIALLLTLAMSVACVATLAACGEKAEPVAALITLHGSSSTYDKNFIDAFNTACQNKGLKKSQYTVKSDIDEDDSCYTAAADFADKGYKAIFADSFGHEDYMIKAAKEFTNVQFYHATGTKAHTEKLANFHNAFASIYEGRYLAGYAAGLLLNTMKNKAKNNNFQVGYIGAYTYAEVISGYTAWFLGLEAALDEGYTATMQVQFTGKWYDETLEKEVANTLIGNGAVLISQHADSMGAPTACQNATVPNVAYNGSTGLNTLVAYSKINWVPYFEMMLDQAMGGAAVATDYTGTMENSSVQWALGPNVAEGTLEKVQAVEKELKAGTRQVFDCSTFTVTKRAAGTNGENDFGLNVNATIDETGHLLQYHADVDTDVAFTGDTDVVKTVNGMRYFAESDKRSAPYFDIQIDRITLLNAIF